MIIPYERPSLTGDLPADVSVFLTAHGCPATVTHCAKVAATAERLARRFDADPRAAADAGWLHDISAVISTPERVSWARRWRIGLLPEEVKAPMILHQKLSAWMAEHSFGVAQVSVLSAIRCHTTLREHANTLDKVVFVADKVSWDQPGLPPYLEELHEALEVSLDAGVCVYLTYLWRQRERLAVVHPWFVAAYRQLCGAA